MAFVCHNDLCASGALRAMAEKGLHSPKDMSFVGFDNIESGKYLTPSLTTIDLKEDEHAVRIFEMLEAQIKSINIEDRNVRIAPELVIRESCAAPSK